MADVTWWGTEPHVVILVLSALTALISFGIVSVCTDEFGFDRNAGTFLGRTANAIATGMRWVFWPSSAVLLVGAVLWVVSWFVN